MKILEQEDYLVSEGLAFGCFLFEFGQFYKDFEFFFAHKLFGLQIHPAFLREKGFSVVSFVVQNPDEEAAGQVIALVSLVDVLGLDARDVKPQPVVCIFELGVLHFKEISAFGAVFAEDVKDDFFAVGSHTQKLGRNVSYSFYWLAQDPAEEVVEQSDEQWNSGRLSENYFESPVNEERREPYGSKPAGKNGDFFRHKCLLLLWLMCSKRITFVKF